MKADMKKYLPYIGIPVLAAALLLVKLKSLEPLQLLLRELLLIFVYLACVTDIKEKRVPNRLVLIMLGAWVIILVPYLFMHTERALITVLSGAVGFALAGILFLLVYIVSRHGLGGGDVKLMAVSGLYLGFGGVLPAMLVGSVLSAVTALILIASKKMDAKGTLPLVPFLYVGMLLTMFFR